MILQMFVCKTLVDDHSKISGKTGIWKTKGWRKHLQGKRIDKRVVNGLYITYCDTYL